MDTDQNNGIDFSNYSGAKRAAGIIDAPLDMEREEKKNKIYIIIIAVCVLLGIVFWVIYFNKSTPPETPPGTTINEDGLPLPR